jgi:hypothetical protein
MGGPRLNGDIPDIRQDNGVEAAADIIKKCEFISYRTLKHSKFREWPNDCPRFIHESAQIETASRSKTSQ